MATTSSAPALPQPQGREDFEVALICALKVEFDAVEALFDEYWDDGSYGKAEGDPNAYTTGRIDNHNVVLAFMPGLGKSHSSSLAASFRTSFTGIRLGLVVGICGGVPYQPDDEELVLGDVILSTGLVQFDLGRQFSDGLVRKDTLADNFGRPNLEIRSLLAKLSSRRSKLQLEKNVATNLRLLLQKEGFERSAYPGREKDKLYKPKYRHKHHNADECKLCEKCIEPTDSPCDDALESSCADLSCRDDQLLPRERLQAVESSAEFNPSVHFGIIGSGDQVMRSAQHRDSIAKREKIIAFEMEGAGVWDAFPTILIKSVADYADSHKNKLWQRYAAAASASCMKAFLVEWRGSTGLGSQQRAQQGLQASQMTTLMSHLMSKQPKEPDSNQKLLFDAIQSRDVDVVKSHIATGQSVSIQTTLGTPLGCAILTGNESMVRLLLEAGADVVTLHKLRWSPVQLALEKKSREILLMLLKGGAKLVAASLPARAMLVNAIRAGHEELLNEMLKQKAYLNGPVEGDYPLIVAAANSNLAAVKTLIQAGADVSKINVKGDSALTVAMLATENNHKIAEAIIKHVPDYMLVYANREGVTPLAAAMRNQPPESIAVLLKSAAVAAAGLETHFDAAIRTGRVEIVESLIASGAKVNSAARGGLASPIHAAAETGSTKIGELLVSHGADLHTVAVDFSECACLNTLGIAVLRGQTEFVAWLISKGIDANAMCDFKVREKPRPPIFLLLRMKDRQDSMLRCLLEHGANIDFQTPFLDSIICEAARNGDIELMKLLIESNASLGTKVTKLPDVPHAQLRDIVPPGRTPLHISAAAGKIDAIELLLAKGAEINAQDVWGCTAIHCIVSSNKSDPLKLLAIQRLVNAGAKIDLKTVRTFSTPNEESNAWISVAPGSYPIHLAAVNLFALETARFLVQNSQTIDLQDENGNTPLHIAVSRPTAILGLIRTGFIPSNQLSVIQMLIENGADVKLQNDKSETAFYLAAKKGDLSMMASLLEAGSDINHSIGGVNALLLSATSKDIRILQMLLERGAKFTPKTVQAAFYRACRHGNPGVVDILLKHDLLEEKETQFFPLHFAAAISGGSRVLELLLKNGADVNRRADDGRTALHEAAANEMTSANVEVLVNMGADKTLKDNAGHTAKDLFEKRTANDPFRKGR